MVAYPRGVVASVRNDRRFGKVLGAAFLMEHFGLSMALGAFLVGLLLQECVR